MNMSQGSNSSNNNPFKTMGGFHGNVMHGGGSAMIQEDEEDNVDAMEMAPSETSSIAELDNKYRPNPPTPYSNTNSSTLQYPHHGNSKMESSQI